MIGPKSRLHFLKVKHHFLFISFDLWAVMYSWDWPGCVWDAGGFSCVNVPGVPAVLKVWMSLILTSVTSYTQMARHLAEPTQSHSQSHGISFTSHNPEYSIKHKLMTASSLISHVKCSQKIVSSGTMTDC